MKFILNSIAVIATVSVQGYKFMHAFGYVLVILGTLLVVSGAFMSLRSVKFRKGHLMRVDSRRKRTYSLCRKSSG